MHAVACLVGDRLRHECRMQVMFFGDGLYRILERHDAVGCLHCFCIHKVDLMLCRTAFVMGSFDDETKRLERQDNIFSGFFSQVIWTEIKIAAFIVGIQSRVAIRIILQKIEFTFRTDIEFVSKICRVVKCFMQHVTRIPLERFSVDPIDITNEAGNFSAFLPPWMNDERIQIRVECHVGFFDPDESVDRGAVETNLVIQRFFQLARRDGNVFHSTKNIRKLQTDKFDVFVINYFTYLILRILHGYL